MHTFVIAAVFGAVLGQSKEVPQVFVPAQTTVAIVPLFNTSGEKWEELKKKQCEKGDTYLREQFASRGFKLVSLSDIQAKAQDLKLDFSDEEQQSRANLFSLGSKLGADIIFFAVITDTSQRVVTQILSSKREGSAKLKLWLLDVKRETPILSAKSIEGKSGGGFFAGLDKGSDRQVIAVANALRDGLKEFFKPYPEPKKEKGKGGGGGL